MRAAMLTCVIIAAFCAHAPRANACSPPEAVSTTFTRHEAPAGGVWWIEGVPDVADIGLELVDDAGETVFAPIVSIGLSGNAAVLVPDVAPGTRFTIEPALFGAAPELVVASGDVATFTDAPRAPALRVEQREVRVGYVSILTVPWPPCTAGGEWGIWNYHFAERPFVVIDDPGDDVVIDVHLQPIDGEPFTPVESANEIVFDARQAAAIEQSIDAPPDAVDTFHVHARVRRIADGAVSEIVTLEVPVDDAAPVEERISLACGCHSSTPASLAPVVLALVVLRSVRRRRV